MKIFDKNTLFIVVGYLVFVVLLQSIVFGAAVLVATWFWNNLIATHTSLPSVSYFQGLSCAMLYVVIKSALVYIARGMYE
jgi:hypothetical protein